MGSEPSVGTSRGPRRDPGAVPAGAPARRAAGPILLSLLVPALLLVGAVPALGHAMLVEASPADGADLDAPPEAVTLTFNEAVDVPGDGLRVFDADAQRVDDGPVDTGSGEVVTVALPEGLPDGGYLVTYRVLSADSHPVSGVIAFTVGGAQPVDEATATGLTDSADGALGAAGSLVRGLGYLATLLAAGAALFALTVARRDEDRGRARRIGVPATGAALVAALLAWPLQAMAVTGLELVDTLDLATLGETLRSSFGQSWLVRVVALAAMVPLWRLRGPLPVAVTGLVAATSFALDGHQRSVEPVALLLAGDSVHLAAAALWFGGLVLLATAVRARSVLDDPVGAARLVRRFSTVATGSVVALAVSGGAMAWSLVRVPGALVSTGYGLLLLAKTALVVLAVGVAVYNRWWLVPAVAARVPAGGSADAPTSAPATAPRARVAWRRLGGTLCVEALLLVAALLVTGFLVVQRPAAEAAGATGLYDTTVAVTDDLDLDVVVDPNRAGEVNAIHLYALDATGRPAGDVEDLELRLTYAQADIGPFVVEPFPAGPGHWVANVDELTFAGDWTLQVVLGVDRFTEERVELTVPVR